MEHKIGEIITLPDGRKAQVVENDSSCAECMFNYPDRYCLVIAGSCIGMLRKDGIDIIYKEIKEEQQ